MKLLEIMQKAAIIDSAPIWMIIAAGFLLLSADLLLKESKLKNIMLFVLSLAAITLSLLFTLYLYPYVHNGYYFQGSLFLGSFGFFLIGLLLMILLFTVIFSYPWLEKYCRNIGEFYALLFWSCSGMMIMPLAQNFIVFFIGLELLSIPLYLLCAFRAEEKSSVEAGLKYFYLGAFSTALLLFGIAFIYGALGTIDFNQIFEKLHSSAPAASRNMLYLGLALTLTGIFFKIAVVPFQMWAPDVYQGAPSNITGFMASGVKIAAFAVLFRLCCLLFLPLAVSWSGILYWLCLATMLVGNLAAIAQTNVKRMLAYSSIAHAGYLLIAIVTNNGLRPDKDLAVALFFYLLAYSLMTLGTFAVALIVENGKNSGPQLNDFSGLSQQKPVLSLAMAVFLFSLAGFPPTAGFFAKFYLFKAALAQGAYFLVIFAIFNSLISVYYYLRVIYYMYMKPAAEGQGGFAVPLLQLFSSLVLVGAIIGLGLFPAGWLSFLSVLFST